MHINLSPENLNFSHKKIYRQIIKYQSIYQINASPKTKRSHHPRVQETSSVLKVRHPPSWTQPSLNQDGRLDYQPLG
jgi:hypothetical protein